MWVARPNRHGFGELPGASRVGWSLLPSGSQMSPMPPPAAADRDATGAGGQHSSPTFASGSRTWLTPPKTTGDAEASKQHAGSSFRQPAWPRTTRGGAACFAPRDPCGAGAPTPKSELPNDPLDTERSARRSRWGAAQRGVNAERRQPAGSYSACTRALRPRTPTYAHACRAAGARASD